MLYQPITRLASNQLAGFEALLRWDHPTRGRLGAEDFIPLAEESGLIVELGSYVLGQALEEAGRWHKLLPRDRDPLFVSVNVSSRQLFRQDMVQEIRLMLAREAVPKGTLKLEITESLVMENPERAVEILTWLKTFGASLALDDFGTGYSSLSYLHRFPVDTIKVDRSLVRDSGLERLDPAHPPLGHRAGARARQGGRGRGRRDAGRRQPISARSAANTARAIITASRCRPRTWRACSPPSPVTASAASASVPVRRPSRRRQGTGRAGRWRGAGSCSAGSRHGSIGTNGWAQSWPTRKPKWPTWTDQNLLPIFRDTNWGEELMKWSQAICASILVDSFYATHGLSPRGVN